MPDQTNNIPPEIKYRQPGAFDHDRHKSWFTAHHILAYILFGMLGLAIVTSSLFYIQYRRTKLEFEPVVHHAATVSTDWKTYRDPSYGFQISYPPDLAFFDLSGTPGQDSLLSLVFYDNKNHDPHLTPQLVSIDIYTAADWNKGIINTKEEIKFNSNSKYVFAYALISPVRDISVDSIISTFKFMEVGTIEGSLSYPSSGIPGTLSACGKNIDTQEIFCVGQIKGSKYQYGVGYKLQVPPGNYYVYAALGKTDMANAYYSEYVTCGIQYGCPSHEPIVVKVAANQIVSDINPQDWYVNQ